jgi:hypothetical protein
MDVCALPFKIHRFIFEVEALDPLHLPAFAGSALRGAYGHALKRLVCMTHAPQCSGCALIGTCAYPLLFEPPSVAPAGNTVIYRSPPYAFEPPAIGQNFVAAGTSWRFGLRLFAVPESKLPIVFEAIRRSLTNGLTTRKSRGRLSRILVETTNGLEDIFDPSKETIVAIPDHAGWTPKLDYPVGFSRLQFVTPLRLQSNGKRLPLQAISVKRIIVDIIRRVRALAANANSPGSSFYVEDPESIAWLRDLPDLPVAHDLTWFDWERSSSRQGRIIRTGGWIGKIELPNLPEPAKTTMRIGAHIGVGKETAFGFGQYQI